MKYFALGLAIVLLAAGAGLGGAALVAPKAEPGVPVVVQVVPLESLPSYDTLEEAAVHAAERAYKCSHAYECGGSIAQRPDGRFVVGPVKSTYSGDSVAISHAVPGGWKLVADYHSHPCNAKSHEVAFFSPLDIEGSTMDRITGIMVDLCTGNVHEFTPGRDSPNNEKVVDGVYLTQGRIVGHITVDGKSQEPLTGSI